MKTKTIVRNPSDLARHTIDNENVYIQEDFAMVRSISSIKHTPIIEIVKSPQYITVGRIVIIQDGTANFRVNMRPFSVYRGSVLIIPPNNYISISEVSDDFDGEIISYSQNRIEVVNCICLLPEAEDFSRIQQYADLLWNIVKRPFNKVTVTHLLDALLSDLLQSYAQEKKLENEILTRGESLFQRFLDTYRREDLPRNIKAYADILCVSPNHLSSVVRKESGRSVMDWINEYCILRAQVLLRHSSTPIYDISERLGFKSPTFFSRYFRRLTGQTPSKYRNQKK